MGLFHTVVPARTESAPFAYLVAAPIARRGRAAQLEALAAVDRLVVARLEGDFCVLATLRANSRIHLARTGGVTTTAATRVAIAGGIATAATGVAAVVATGRPLGLALGAAACAALRLGVATLRVERLLTCRKSKCLATIAAGNRSVAQLAETSLYWPCFITWHYTKNGTRVKRFRRNRTLDNAHERSQTSTYASISSGCSYYSRNVSRYQRRMWQSMPQLPRISSILFHESHPISRPVA